MPHEVIMPALGMAQNTGHLVAWLKKPGDEVAEGDVLFEVETDKATQEVEAQASGFLTDVSAGEGDDVPVGQVIARISETAEDGGTAAPAPAEDPAGADDGLPEGHQVIMPTLGMAQDSGLLVAWHVAPGDQVAEGDILFEVETDKATQEVETQTGGFVAALLAEEGEDVPTGQVIAILTPEAPANPIRRRADAKAAPAPQMADEADSAPAPEPRPAPAPGTKQPAVVAKGGRILASPKLRRLAAERGLDLALLDEAGVPQPYHVRDLDQLEDLARKAPAAASGATQSTRRLTAEVPAAAFSDFAEWLDEEDIAETTALATLLAVAFDTLPATVAVATAAATAKVHVSSDRLSHSRPGADDAGPDLVLRDLRRTALTSVDLGAEDVPVVTLTGSADRLIVTLECSADAMTAEVAIVGLSGFAARLEEPLRHLL